MDQLGTSKLLELSQYTGIGDDLNYNFSPSQAVTEFGFKEMIYDTGHNRSGASRIDVDGTNYSLEHVSKHLVTQRLVVVVVLILKREREKDELFQNECWPKMQTYFKLPKLPRFAADNNGEVTYELPQARISLIKKFVDIVTNGNNRQVDIRHKSSA